MTVDGGKVRSELRSTYLPPNGNPAGLVETPDVIIQRPAGVLPSLGLNDTCFIPGNTITGLAQYLNHSLEGSMMSHTSEGISRTFTNDLMQVLNITTDIGSMVDNMAISMSTWIRTMNQLGPQPITTGRVRHLQVFVHVRWAWLSSPVASVLCTLALLAGTIARSRRNGNLVWKSSGSATLIHRLAGAENPIAREMGGLKEMEDTLTGVNATLRHTETGEIRLVT